MKFKEWVQPFTEDAEGNWIAIVHCNEQLRNEKVRLRKYKVTVPASTVGICREVPRDRSKGGKDLLLEVLESIKKRFERLSPGEDPLDLPHLSHWRYSVEDLDPQPEEPDLPKPYKQAEPERLPLDWFQDWLGLDLAAAWKDTRDKLSPASRTQFRKIIDGIRGGTQGQQRGHAFELRTIQELKEKLYPELLLENYLVEAAGTSVDLTIPSAGGRFELYSSTRDALPTQMHSKDDSEWDTQMKINASVYASNCHFLDAQTSVLLAVVNRKCWEKGLAGLDSLSSPLLLLVDAFYNDLKRNHGFTSNEEWAKEFLAYWKSQRPEYPEKLVVAMKWYDREQGKSLVLPLPRDEGEREELLRTVQAVFVESKVTVFT